MNRRLAFPLFATLALLVFSSVGVLPVSAKPETPKYTVADLGVPWSGTALSFNDHGQVVGYFGDPSHQSNRAFIWQNGATTDLHAEITKTVSSAFGSTAYSINDNGEVVGFACLGAARDYCSAILWQNGTFRDFGAYDMAVAINNKSDILIVNTGVPGVFSESSLIWNPKDNTTLGLAGVGNITIGRRINNKDQVIGTVQSGGSYNGQPLVRYDAFWPDPTTIVQLEPPTGYSSVSLQALNDLSQVVGSATAPDGTRHAILWQGGTPTDLGVFSPQDIDNSGHVLGATTTGPILWHDGTITPLASVLPGKSGWVITSVLGMTSQGTIMGAGLHHGQARVFRLTPKHEQEQGQQGTTKNKT